MPGVTDGHILYTLVDAFSFYLAPKTNKSPKNSTCAHEMLAKIVFLKIKTIIKKTKRCKMETCLLKETNLRRQSLLEKTKTACFYCLINKI